MDEYHIEYDLDKKVILMLHCFLIHQVRCENKAATRRAHETISPSPYFQGGFRISKDTNITARQQSRGKSFEPGVLFPPFSISSHRIVLPHPQHQQQHQPPPHPEPALTFFTIAESSTRPLSHDYAQQPTKLKSPAHKQTIVAWRVMLVLRGAPMASLRSDIRGTDACCRLPTVCRIGPNLSGICGCVCLGRGGMAATTDGKSVFLGFGVWQKWGQLVWGAEMGAGVVVVFRFNSWCGCRCLAAVR
jgi:hypothetical protein